MYQLVFILTTILLITSCKKQSPGELKDLEISGFVFDSTHQTGLANVQIRADWQDTGTVRTLIKTGVTDPKGKFSLKLSVDTSRFKQENIVVSLFAPENYISYGHPQVQEAPPIRHYAAAVAVQRFVLFEKTRLTITFSRTQSDAIVDFQSNYSFFEGASQTLLQFTNAGTTPLFISYIDKETAVGVYTKVGWTKRLASGVIVTHKDSILCRPNTANSVVVHF